jgi:hypothetical protein
VNKRALATLLLLAGIAAGQTKPAHAPTPKPETPHLRFVKEFVRELISDEDLKTNGQKELSEAKTTEEQISTGIYFSKSVQLELRSQIRMLRGMRLAKPFETLIPGLIDFYQHQVELHQSLIDINSKFIAGPRSGVDYQALAAKLPQIRAELDATQKAVFEATPMIFMALIDQKPDSQDHLSHLVITRAEKSELQDQLEIMLKDVPEKGDHDYYISAAMVLRGGLQKGHKCADEPWD